MIKKILLLLLVALVVIQFIHPKKNTSEGPQANYIGNKYPVPDNVKGILAKACNDCHSNNTRYPWYSKLQPVDWWITNHVNEGKKELNFDEFLTRSPRYQYNKIKKAGDEAKEHNMPLNSYLWIHKDAKLTADEIASIENWCGSVQDSLEAHYPMDSLVRKKQPAPEKKEEGEKQEEDKK
jgi:hypothetical protein